jgi:uncharacterized iron-regulated membrane protein
VKLAPRTFQIFWDAHAWAGVLASLLLYVMFFMGAFALFYPEINVWAEPGAAAPPPLARPRLQPLLEQLDREVGLAGAERVAFMREHTGLRASVSKQGDYTDFRYAPESGRLERTRSDLGSFLYTMHYLGPLPCGIWMAGLCSMALLLAIVSGLFVHAKDLIRQGFQFRPERVARTWTSDLHKVLGVFGLPYQLLYAWTGAVLCLGYLVVEPVFLQALFGGDTTARAVARGEPAEASLQPTGKRVTPLADVDALVAVAERRLLGSSANWIGIEHVADEASTVIVSGDVEGSALEHSALEHSAFGSVEVVLRARDGAVLRAQGPAEASAYQRFDAWFHGLHYARFGGYAIKLLYALLALGTCAVIATGNVVWLERRDRRRAHVGNRILERLTTGVCAGVILATAAAFLGNRLLPANLPGRAVREQWVFWATGLPAVLVPLVWREPRRVAGVELLLAGVLLSLVVLLDVTLRPSTLNGPIHRGVLLGLALLGSACLLGGARLRRPGGSPRPLRASSSQAAHRASSA